MTQTKLGLNLLSLKLGFNWMCWKLIHVHYFSELLKVETPDQYEKELWQLNADERIALIPTLKEKGNKLYAQKLYDEAEEVYNEALAICEQLMVR